MILYAFKLTCCHRPVWQTSQRTLVTIPVMQPCRGLETCKDRVRFPPTLADCKHAVQRETCVQGPCDVVGYA